MACEIFFFRGEKTRLVMDLQQRNFDGKSSGKSKKPLGKWRIQWKSRLPQHKAMWTHFDYRLWRGGMNGSTWDPSSCDFGNPIMTHCFLNLLLQLLNSSTADKNI